MLFIGINDDDFLTKQISIVGFNMCLQQYAGLISVVTDNDLWGLI
jgi:hypothetical protein